MVYSLSMGIIFEATNLVTRNITYVSKNQTEIEEFTDAASYISMEARGKRGMLITHPSWSVLALETVPVVAYQIISGNGKYKLRRLVAKGKVDIETLKKGPGLSFFNSKFTGFNTVYSGNREIGFIEEEGYAVMEYADKKLFLVPVF